MLSKLKILLFVVILVSGLNAGDILKFGVISTISPSQMAKKMSPLLAYLSDKIGKKVVFKTGKDYADTIAKFNSGEFDIGYIGPSPYIIATSKENNLDILAGIETKGKPFFYGVIVAKKGNNSLNTLADLKGKKFAFGSRQSTLSFYAPAKNLLDAGVKDQLKEYKFLGKHDKVAKAVISKKFAAGGIKESVANKYAKKLKVIHKSEPIYDFMIVGHKTTSDADKKALKDAMLSLKDKKILTSLKKGATGFVETSSDNYDNLRKMMQEVDAVYPK